MTMILNCYPLTGQMSLFMKYSIDDLWVISTSGTYKSNTMSQSITRGEYRICYGSFLNEQFAKDLIKKLTKSSNRTLTISTVSVFGKLRFRVVSNTGMDYQTAKSLLTKEVQLTGIKNLWLTSEEQRVASLPK